MNRGLVLSLVEHGWRATRECALAILPGGCTVTHLVRGTVPPDVRAVIRLQPGERLVGVPRPLYRVARTALFAVAALDRRACWVLADNERTLKEAAWWCRACGWTAVLDEEVENRCVYRVGGRERTPDEIFGLT